MTRDATPYGSDERRKQGSAMRAPINGAGGAEEPVAGFYRGKLRSKGALVGFRIWYGAPLDPLTGEEMDRSHRWQCLCNDEYVEIEDVWPYGAQLIITEREYNKFCQQQKWALQYAPDSALANPRRKSDPLTAPLYF